MSACVSSKLSNSWQCICHWINAMSKGAKVIQNFVKYAKWQEKNLRRSCCCESESRSEKSCPKEYKHNKSFVLCAKELYKLKLLLCVWWCDVQVNFAYYLTCNWFTSFYKVFFLCRCLLCIENVWEKSCNKLDALPFGSKT